MSFSDVMAKYAPDMSAEQLSRFSVYYEMLTDWNENRCNLTAITDPDEVAEKHFLDSVLPERLIPHGASCIDIGTGAGFPGVPLLIMRPDISMTLVDSLQKRVAFLEALRDALGLDLRIYHARAEDAGRDVHFREKYDVTLTRAVAHTAVLLEWTSPFLKVGGTSLMYKSSAAGNELCESERALSVLGMEAYTESFSASWGERCVTVAKKLRKTPPAYPRKAGEAKRKPLT